MQTITVYSLEELKVSFPNAYAKVLQKWRNDCVGRESNNLDDIMHSLNAVVDVCGFKLTDYAIRAYGHSYIYVQDVIDSRNDNHLEWFEENVLRDNGYLNKLDEVDFSGQCALTGSGYDDDLLEMVYENLLDGYTLATALYRLAKPIQKMLECDEEYAQREECMLENWGDKHYTATGIEVF